MAQLAFTLNTTTVDQDPDLSLRPPITLSVPLNQLEPNHRSISEHRHRPLVKSTSSARLPVQLPLRLPLQLHQCPGTWQVRTHLIFTAPDHSGVVESAIPLPAVLGDLCAVRSIAILLSIECGSLNCVSLHDTSHQRLVVA